MSKNKKDPAAGWTHEGGGVWVPPLHPSEGATSDQLAPQGSLRCDALVLLLREAEMEYKTAVLEYEKAEGEGVSSFHEYNTVNYKKGIRDAYRNLIQQNK